jgi:hypothetical protein
MPNGICRCAYRAPRRLTSILAAAMDKSVAPQQEFVEALRGLALTLEALAGMLKALRCELIASGATIAVHPEEP